MKLLSLRRGFTLIEMLLVIGIIAILAAIVIVAINPTKQLGDARNAQRRSDVNTILNAVYQYSLDNQGNFPSTIPVAPTAAGEICNTYQANVDCGALVNLAVLTGSYLVGIPRDPQNDPTAQGTDYNIVELASGRITVSAMAPEQSAVISVTR